jgi:hypothetical protein
VNPIDIARKLGHLPWLTPLSGKVPILGAWQTREPATEADVAGWLEQGHNLGLRCGSRSGLFVIDDDQIKHGGGGYTPPPTGLVAESPTGGRHHYFIAPDPCPGNSANRLAPHVDTRGEGGQVVYPGSTHPAGGLYQWIEVGPPAELPPDVLAALVPVRIDMNRPAPPIDRPAQGYADTALVREAARVRAAPEGGRNDALNRAAFSLGQLVAGGALSEAQVRDELASAAAIAGLSEREAHSTIRSGLTAGAAQPRRVPVGVTVRPRPIIATPGRPEILVPGSHILRGGEYVEQGCDTFARGVLESLEPGAIYRRAGTVGRIIDGAFRIINPDRMRSLLDQHIRFGVGKAGKEGEEASVVFRPCTGDAAKLVAAYAEADGDVRELETIATYPVLIGDDFEPAAPGWNADARTYLVCDEVPPPLDLPTAKAVLEDLVVDFPFQSPADRANYFGLLLTPILRPALREPSPMHLIGSPIERTGKSKLASTVFGISITGKTLPDAQIGVREEEREKRITALLLSGVGCAHLDNLTRFIDSPALASLLTSTVYQGRELNFSRMLTLPNQLTLVGTGNNVQATGEVAKRIVPITLQSPLEAPETRQDYRHPDLRAFVEAERPRVLGALLGLVKAWKDAGRPRGSVAFGGFERWAATVGGIMAVAGYPEWLTNLGQWRGGSDEFSGELMVFLESWVQIRDGREYVPISELYDVAAREELFDRLLHQGTDHGKRIAFGRDVMGVIDGRTISGYRVSVVGKGRHRRAKLTEA